MTMTMMMNWDAKTLKFDDLPDLTKLSPLGAESKDGVRQAGRRLQPQRLQGLQQLEPRGYAQPMIDRLASRSIDFAGSRRLGLLLETAV